MPPAACPWPDGIAMIESASSFRGYSIVSCGTMRPELDFLRESGFLDADKIIYAAPGLHENQRELKRQLKEKLELAGKISEKTIVVYGSRCYLNFKDPFYTIDAIAAEAGMGIASVEAGNCVEMLATAEERDAIAGGGKNLLAHHRLVVVLENHIQGLGWGEGERDLPPEPQGRHPGSAEQFRALCSAAPRKGARNLRLDENPVGGLSGHLEKVQITSAPG